MLLGPVGMFLAYVLSSPDKREPRLFGALTGSFVAGATMLVALLIVLLAVTLL
jgi:hypothetical protein